MKKKEKVVKKAAAENIYTMRALFTKKRDKITCPRCYYDFEHHPDVYKAVNNPESNEQSEHKCPMCGKDFTLFRVMVIKYSTYALLEEEEK